MFIPYGAMCKRLKQLIVQLEKRKRNKRDSILDNCISGTEQLLRLLSKTAWTQKYFSIPYKYFCLYFETIVQQCRKFS